MRNASHPRPHKRQRAHRGALSDCDCVHLHNPVLSKSHAEKYLFNKCWVRVGWRAHRGSVHQCERARKTHVRMVYGVRCLCVCVVVHTFRIQSAVVAHHHTNALISIHTRTHTQPEQCSAVGADARARCTRCLMPNTLWAAELAGARAPLAVCFGNMSGMCADMRSRARARAHAMPGLTPQRPQTRVRLHADFPPANAAGNCVIELVELKSTKKGE